MSAEVYLERHGPRADLVLNRPDKRNALNLAMWAAIPGLLAEVTDDARLLVVRGAGDAFAAGADIAEFETAYSTRAAALANQATMAAAMSALETFPAPTVAAIRGACVGGGCGLALCADIRIATHDARLGITPAKLGLSYGVADTRRLVQAIGASAAKDMLFTGRLHDAAEAWRIGLVDRVVAPDGLDGAVDGLLSELCAASGFTARAVKQTFRLLRGGAVDDTEESRRLFAAAFEGPDFREGVAAFSQKRRPDFS